jgi:hypothetical protein
MDIHDIPEVAYKLKRFGDVPGLINVHILGW